MLNTVTPLNISEMSLQEVLGLVKEEIPGLPNKKARLTIVEALYSILGLTLTPDAALCLVEEPLYQQIIAVAGAGKTTLSQIKIILKKLLYKAVHKTELRGSKVLCIVYNDHNVEPMVQAHKSMVRRIKSRNVSGFDIDDEIYATTLHSFCNQWIWEYRLSLGMTGSILMKDTDQVALFNSAVTMIRPFKEIPEDLNIKNLIKAYTLAREQLLAFDDPKMADQLRELNLSADSFKFVCTAFDKLKKSGNKHNFQDQLLIFKGLMENNQEARERIQRYYSYVVVDEVQDFTPLMMAITRLVVGKNQALMIGDEDQVIYDFNGADVDNILRFSEVFEGGRVYILNTNRRCSSEVVEAAAVVVETNQKRFAKKILPARQGGKVEMVGYSTEEGQILNIIKHLKSMPQEDWDGVSICYRNNDQSILLTEMLEKNNITFNLVSGYEPFGHELYGHCIDVLNALESPYSMLGQINLRKALPISEKEIHTILGYDSVKQRFKDDKVRCHFADVDFGAFMLRPAFVQGFDILKRISKNMRNYPLQDYFKTLFDMICKYYWLNKKKYNADRKRELELLDNIFTPKVFEFFNSPKTYSELFADYSQRMDLFKRNSEAGRGVTVSTMHGLKGREFKESHILFLDDNIFPSAEIDYSEPIDLEDVLSMQTEISVKVPESATRLMYVAMTRPKFSLFLHYKIDNPSYYIKLLQEHYKNKKSSEVAATTEIVNIDLTELDVSPVAAAPKALNIKSSTNGSNAYLDNIFKRI